MERQDAGPQPWKILSKGRVEVGPAGKLGGQSGAGPSPPNGIQPAQGSPEVTPRSSLSEPCNPPTPAAAEAAPVSLPCSRGLPAVVPFSPFCGQRPHGERIRTSAGPQKARPPAPAAFIWVPSPPQASCTP